MKQLFTKTQAVSVLVQIKANQQIDIFKPVDAKHNLFNYSCEDLEKKLLVYLQEDGFAGVIDDPIISKKE